MKLVIISGRDRETFEDWFAGKDYTLITDHGVWLKQKDEDWQMLEHIKNDWMASILPVLEDFVDRTPGTFVEKKNIRWPGITEKQTQNWLKYELLN